ncbi:MAG: hypothetical protein KGL39_08095 [Patescibacteria group bacterium]|nr:hypothetical protein [Patescibacteria group bacterium]
MDTIYVAWIRRISPNTLRRDHWERMYEFFSLQDALNWIDEYCRNRKDASGVALPNGEKPVQRKTHQ